MCRLLTILRRGSYDKIVHLGDATKLLKRGWDFRRVINVGIRLDGQSPNGHGRRNMGRRSTSDALPVKSHQKLRENHTETYRESLLIFLKFGHQKNGHAPYYHTQRLHGGPQTPNCTHIHKTPSNIVSNQKSQVEFKN